MVSDPRSTAIVAKTNWGALHRTRFAEILRWSLVMADLNSWAVSLPAANQLVNQVLIHKTKTSWLLVSGISLAILPPVWLAVFELLITFGSTFMAFDRVYDAPADVPIKLYQPISDWFLLIWFHFSPQHEIIWKFFAKWLNRSASAVALSLCHPRHLKTNINQQINIKRTSTKPSKRPMNIMTDKDTK